MLLTLLLLRQLFSKTTEILTVGFYVEALAEYYQTNTNMTWFQFILKFHFEKIANSSKGVNVINKAVTAVESESPPLM